MSLKGTYHGGYRKKGTGQRMIIYALSGSAKELAKYKELQAENYRDSNSDGTGIPFFFMSATNPDGSYKVIDKQISLIETGGDNPRFVVDDMQAEFALAAQVQSNLAIEIAKGMASKLVSGNQRQATPAPVQQVTTPVTVADSTVADLENVIVEGEVTPAEVGADTLGE